MMKEKINDIEIVYEKKYMQEKDIFKIDYKEISNLVTNLWGLIKPKNIKIFITDSDVKYSLYAYSFSQKLMILIIFPYWYIKTRESFKTFGVVDINAKEPSILIKPVKFFDSSKSKVSGLIYRKSKNIKEKYRDGYISLFIAMRSYELKLVNWLESGISSLTSERFLSKHVVKKETINMLNKRNMLMDYDNINTAYPHVVGYWTVRYLEENYPGFLKEIFKEYKGEEIVEQIRLKLGLNQEDFWEQLDELLYENYKHLLDN